VAAVPLPTREPKAFAKLELAPGEARRVELRLGPRDLAFFDPDRRAWRVEAGRFDVLAGFSAADIRGTARIDLPADRTLDP
jgi:beta-glucosidase